MWLYYLSSIALLLALASARGAASKVYFRNDGDRLVKVSWINVDTGDRVFMLELAEDSRQSLDSYVDHQFEIEEVGGCEPEGNCVTNIVTVSKFPSQCKFAAIR
jgi:hypothetical protein